MGGGPGDGFRRRVLRCMTSIMAARRRQRGGRSAQPRRCEYRRGRNGLQDASAGPIQDPAPAAAQSGPMRGPVGGRLQPVAAGRGRTGPERTGSEDDRRDLAALCHLHHQRRRHAGEEALPREAPHAGATCASLTLSPASCRKVLRFAAIVLCTARSIFARACGRVSIGGHPDKRPDSRLGSVRLSNHAIGSRRRNRHSLLSAGDAA